MTHEYIETVEKIAPDLNYQRPVFVLPATNSPDANTFFLFKRFLDTLRDTGYSDEHVFIKRHFIQQDFGEFVLPRNGVFTTNDLNGILVFMHNFVELSEVHTAEIIEDNNEFIITKTKKNGVLVQNNPYFSKAKLSIARVMMADTDTKSDILQKNNYHKNILWYLPVEDAITLIEEFPELKKSALDLDVFDQRFFTHKINLENFLSITNFLENTLELNKDDISDILHTSDVFNYSPFDYLLYQFDKSFTKIKNYSESLSKTYFLDKTNISEPGQGFLDIIYTVHDIMKYDETLGDKLHQAIYDKKSPLFKEVGIYFKSFSEQVQKFVDSDKSLHPSFEKFLVLSKEFELRKTLENIDAQNPALAESKIKSSKQKI